MLDEDRRGWVEAREQAFHDRIAAELDPRSMPPDRPIQFDELLLDAIGDVEGKAVLDLGCGAGDISLKLVQRGAKVTGVDISERLIEVAGERADHFPPGAPVSFVAAPADRTGLAAAEFDLIVGKWILHHVALDPVLTEIGRLLRPGGSGVFFENQLTNPILAFGREHLIGRRGVRRIGTSDEHPLRPADFALLGERFARVQLRHPDFCFFELLDRQLLDFRYPRITGFVRALDRRLWAAWPPIRRFSYHVVIRLAEPRSGMRRRV